MTRDRATLELVGVSLHGKLWHAALARDLNVDLRTLQRWDKSQFDIPPGIWPDLAELCRKRGLYLAALARELDTIPEVSDSTVLRTKPVPGVGEHHRCLHCREYIDQCRCDGGLPI